MEFGLPPNILEVTDVSQLISLMVARDALEDAGYGEDRTFDREHTGCILGFVGTSSKLFTPLMTRLQYPVWEKVLRSAGVSEGDTNKIIEKIKLAYVGWEENSFPGAIGNVVTGRICNRFDLGGTNCVVDAACASSLAAVRMAVAELIEGRASMMITGGVDTDNSINSYLCFSKTPAFTQKETVRSFDAESGGMIVGEGLGMIVLKRLEDAERDGDRVYAVIKAVGSSSDGRYKSIYAPRPSGQAQALRRAYAEAGFEPATVGMVEAHGTGTTAGDPAEFEGLKEVFGKNSERRQYIALGSVKSQIGHTKAAAGVASLIKTSLALYHKVLPPTINVTRPNPKLGIDQTPLYLNTETRPWIRARNGYPRRAGVSSFGFGGTNFHVVLEEAQNEHTGAYRLNTVAQPVLLFAADSARLLEACRNALKDLQGEQAQASFHNLVCTSRTLEVPQEQARVGFVAETVDEARETLKLCIDWLAGEAKQDSWEHPKGIFYRRSGLDPQGKVVALFSGQGSQYLDMGRELAVNFPPVREVFSAVDEMFIQDEMEPLSSHVYPRPVFTPAEREALVEKLTRTEYAQPAIGSLSVGLYKLLNQAGFKPDFVAGHSFGELTALWAAGVLSEHDYYLLAKARGKAMAPPPDPDYDAGTMAAVKGDVEQIRAALASDLEVTLANWNSNDQMVIAGPRAAVSRAQVQLERQGFGVILLPVSAAFHTALVGHAQKPFAKAIQSVKFNRPRVPVYSNSTAQAHSEDARLIQSALAEHILKPVLFRDEIQNIYAAGGSIFVEFGPKNVLTNLVNNILAGKPHLAVALNANAKKDSDRQLREAVMALRVAGLPLTNFDPYVAERKVGAPRKKSPVTVQLNGGFYVSERTRSAFEKALNDGFKIQAQPVPQDPQPAVLPYPPAEPAARELSVTTMEQPAMNVTSNGNPEQLLAEYQAHQSETLRLHEQYLRTEEEYASAFVQLIQLQSELVSKSVNGLQSVQPLFESLERSMMRFHEHQAETLRIHQRYLETQERFSNSFLQALTGEARSTVQAAPVLEQPRPITIPAPAPVVISAPMMEPATPKSNGSAPVAPVPQPVKAAGPAVVGITAEQLKNALLAIVSEKTGYPVETLELDMDMEADLGIDSIKRVEILGAMQAQFTDLPAVDNTTLAELRTLGQITQALAGGSLLEPAAQQVSLELQPVVERPRASARRSAH
jgi:polyketide-type polyunsaturated fatty acid synthase PfaA